jgi:hypothetical protein
VSTDGQTKIKQSNDPDFNGFIPTGNGGNTGYLFTNWEDRPGGMSRINIAKGDDGKWSVGPDGAIMIDFAPVNGTWVNCFGSVSPWDTPLTSEELYFDDTADWNNAADEEHDGQVALEKYLGKYPNPYDYGYIIEINDPTGVPIPKKHYVMGRYSHENSVVMPDQKTVYLTDDGTGVVFFKFIADQPGDLSAGTLYAAKMTQDDGDDPAKVGFDIEWIEIAESDDAIAGFASTTESPRPTTPKVPPATSPTTTSPPGPRAKARTTASPSSRPARRRPPKARRPSSARWKAS